ncbi:Major facilitator sugar transporter-like [Trinorchestia longiramus]|nr:Major facilitator sugar transporter-like [Trinorchestia longiramus]
MKWSSPKDPPRLASELHSVDDVFEMVGTKGALNILIFIACSAVGLMTPMQVMSADFLGKSAPHWCAVQPLLDANWTAEQIRNFSSPDPTDDATCVMLDYNYSAAAELGYLAALDDLSLVPGGEGNVSCEALMFQEGVDSIVTEWALACDRLVYLSHTVAAAQAGIFIGSIFFGYFIDRAGRRVGMLIGVTLFVPCGLAVAASVNVYMYIAFRILVTMFGIGMYLAGFVLSMELCTTAQRSLVSSYFVIPWAVGYMATAAIAYGISRWRLLQVACTVPGIFVLCNICLIPESPRWLLKNGRYDDALSVFKKMAARNKRTLPNDDEMMAALMRVCPRETIKSEGCAVMPWLRKWVLPQFQVRTPIVFFCWLSVAMVYYGLSQGSANLGVDEYQFIFVGGALEIVSYIAIYPGVTWLGRRWFLCLSYAIAAVSIFGVMGMMLSGYDGSNGGLVFLSYSGKLMITASFHVLYMITGELFSTQLRTLMIGESSVCARIGSLSSPYINIMIGSKQRWAPAAFFGTFSMASAILSAFLPETREASLDGDVSKSTKDHPSGEGGQAGTTNPALNMIDETISTTF